MESSFCQLETDAPDGFQVGVGAGGFELAADVAHVYGDGLFLHEAFLVPGCFEQFALREHLLGPAHEGFDDAEFEAREPYGLAGGGEGARFCVERPVFETQHAGGVSGAAGGVA